MSEKKYLYYHDKWNGLQRREIVRETASFYFVGREESKVRKINLQRSDGFTAIQYYEETPELSKEYETVMKKRGLLVLYYDKLDKLRRVDNVDTIKKVMEIEI
jgi:hypothetical protein